MARRTDMTRQHSALLLGIDESSSADDIQRAWKMWVRLAHPDVGGDRDHFEALMRARRILLANVVQANALKADTAPAVEQAVPDRPSLRSVIRQPSGRAAIVLVSLVAVALASPAVTLSQIDLFITPMLACGDNGIRLGYGGGYYDRIFSEARGFRLGVGFSLQRVDGWETEPHDERLWGFLSERRLELFSPKK